MAFTSFAQVLADVKKRHPKSSSKAILGTAQKNWANIQANMKKKSVPPPPAANASAKYDVSEYDPEEYARQKAVTAPPPMQAGDLWLGILNQVQQKALQ